jgi:hypothetical protein
MNLLYLHFLYLPVNFVATLYSIYPGDCLITLPSSYTVTRPEFKIRYPGRVFGAKNVSAMWAVVLSRVFHGMAILMACHQNFPSFY